MNYLIPGVALAVSSFLSSGCVSAKYQLADERALPAMPIDIQGAQSSVGLNLKNVIIYRGPGSWKRNAYWDEYQVSVTNTGPTPLTIESVGLTDFLGQAVEPGDDPWVLETQSRTFEAEMASAHKDLLKIGGGAALIGTGGAVVGLLPVMAGIAPIAFAAIPALVAAPIVIGVSIKKNNNRKRLIESTFAQRRLVLPATIAPGQSAQGSLFFRITPGPRSFNLNYRDGGEPRQVSFELAQLATLHL